MKPPDLVGRWALFAATCVWSGAWSGRFIGLTIVIPLVVLAAAMGVAGKRLAATMAVIALAGALSGALSVQRELAILETPVPEGIVEVGGTVREDPRPGHNGYWFLIDPASLSTRDRQFAWQGPRLLVSSDKESNVMAGDQVMVAGRLTAGPGLARGDSYAGRIAARSIDEVAVASGIFRAANLLRSAVDRRLDSIADRPAAALVSGFLIGDVRELPQADAEALRRAGLSHFVAVSGSNVALFLALWWVIIGPFGFGPRRRAVFGLAGLALFIVVTRWEPSVLRASVMAGLLLSARAIGMSIGPWTALGGGVAVLVLVSGELVSDVGFQLSVAATAGVIAGAGYRPLKRFRFLGPALAATIAAQLAVAPLLLLHFGSLPLFTPLTNLIAGPLVVASTSLAGIGVLTANDLLTGLSTSIAGVVLDIARVASPWPQVGWFGYCGVMGVIGFVRVSGLRRPALVLAAAWAFMAIGVQSTPVDLPAIVFLDVGQGDATLLLSDDGSVVLIDGGPDPSVLIERIRKYGVDRVDLLIATHQHHDHVAGLIAALEHVPVGLVWHAGHTHLEADMRRLLDTASTLDVPAEVVRPGWMVRVGSFQLTVKGPIRRYASANDQSIVLVVEMDTQTILMSGDVEVYAQSDLGPIRADILKVPHQGAATSDLDWIRATGAEVAIIPVGPNDYGHPSPDVIGVLEEMGAEVYRTDEDGDIVISAGG